MDAVSNEFVLEPAALDMLYETFSNDRTRFGQFLKLADDGTGSMGASRVREILAAIGLHSNGRIGTSTNIGSMSGQNCEIYISELLRKMGFRTEMTKASGDGGIDVIAELETLVLADVICFNVSDTPTNHRSSRPPLEIFTGQSLPTGKQLRVS